MLSPSHKHREPRPKPQAHDVSKKAMTEVACHRFSFLASAGARLRLQPWRPHLHTTYTGSQSPTAVLYAWVARLFSPPTPPLGRANVATKGRARADLQPRCGGTGSGISHLLPLRSSSVSPLTDRRRRTDIGQVIGSAGIFSTLRLRSPRSMLHPPQRGRILRSSSHWRLGRVYPPRAWVQGSGPL